MGIGHQDAPAAARAQLGQQGAGMGALGNEVRHLVFEFGDIHRQLRRPVVCAVPLQSVPLAIKARQEFRAAGCGVEAAQLGEAAGQMVLPEVIVEMEVEQGAVHIEENSVDGAPVDHPT